MSHSSNRCCSSARIGFSWVVLAVVAVASAQAARTPERSFSEETRVVAVEVPINVVDRKGEPVRGLSADDFEVYDDGKLQAVSDFEVIDLAVLENAPLASAPEQTKAAARRHFLMLFDVSFSDPPAIAKARLAAREFVLSKLHPSDLVAVAIYSLESGPRMVLTFTPDRAQIAHAIDSLGVNRSLEIDPLRFIITPVSSEGMDASMTANQRRSERESNGQAAAVSESQQIAIEQLNRNERTYQRSQIASFSRSLGEMAHILASVPGRKHVVLFSEGFDSHLLTGTPIDNAIEGDQRALQIQGGETWRVESEDLYGDSGLQSKVRGMLQEFRRADCVIQAVDIGGLRAETDAKSTNSSSSGQESLFYMANETGGALFRNSNDLQSQLEGVLDRSSVTYLLTFQRSDVKADGTYRRLRVKLKNDKGGDYRISYRQGYYAPRPFSDLHPLEKDLIASDAIATATATSDLRLDVLAAPFRATPEWSYVPVIVEINGKSLLAGLDGNTLPVEIYTYVTNDKGEMQDFFTQKVSLDVSRGRQQLTDQGVKYYGHLQLAAGRYQVRVLVRNAATGISGVQLFALTVPPYSAEQTVVLPPFFPEAPGRWLMVRERQTVRSNDSTIYPFTINGEPYVPAALPQIEAGKPASFCVVAYNLGQGQISLAGELFDQQGQPVTGADVKLIERTTTGIAGYDKFLATFDPIMVATGDYTLKVALTDPESGRSQTNSIRIRVR